MDLYNNLRAANAVTDLIKCTQGISIGFVHLYLTATDHKCALAKWLCVFWQRLASVHFHVASKYANQPVANRLSLIFYFL